MKWLKAFLGHCQSKMEGGISRAKDPRSCFILVETWCSKVASRGLGQGHRFEDSPFSHEVHWANSNLGKQKGWIALIYCPLGVVRRNPNRFPKGFSLPEFAMPWGTLRGA